MKIGIILALISVISVVSGVKLSRKRHQHEKVTKKKDFIADDPFVQHVFSVPALNAARLVAPQVVYHPLPVQQVVYHPPPLVHSMYVHTPYPLYYLNNIARPYICRRLSKHKATKK